MYDGTSVLEADRGRVCGMEVESEYLETLMSDVLHFTMATSTVTNVGQSCVRYLKRIVKKIFMSFEQQCVMCLDSVGVSSVSKVETTRCKHTFHEECLRTWLQWKHTCPCCRTPLRLPCTTWHDDDILPEDEYIEFEIPDEEDLTDDSEEEN